MRIIPFALLILASTVLSGQSLNIYYDALTEDVLCVRGSDTLSSPQVKRGETILLHVENFNNYLYDIEIKESQVKQIVYSSQVDTTNLRNATGGGTNPAMSMLSLLGAPGGMFNFDMLANDQLGLLGGWTTGGKGFAGDAESQALSSEMNALKGQYQNALSEMVTIEQNLISLNEDIEKKLNVRALQGIAVTEVSKVQLNPRLTPDQIKDLCTEYVELVFGKNGAEDLDIESLWKKSKENRNINSTLAEAEIERAAYVNKLNEIKEIEQQVILLDSRVSTNLNPSIQEAYAALNQSVKGTLESGSKVAESLDGHKEEIERLSSVSAETELEELIQLRYNYEELMNNNFSYTYRTTAREDATMLEVTLRPKENLPENLISPTKVLAPIEIASNGGLKVNASFGLGFGQFFNQPQNYFIRDSVILAEDTDSFTPMIASFIHFYRHSSKQTTVGGTFGIGVPLLGSEGGQSLAFFLGPSLVMGGQQRVVISAGVMGGRVTTLAEGYEPGDVFKPEFIGTPIPTAQEYQLGYFVGLSLNIVGNN